MKRLLYIMTALLLAASCARMGSPDGGWYDDDPPRVVGSMPAEQATGVSSSKVTIFFDEYIKLDNASEKVIISPPQMEAPDIKASGRKIIVELKDSLQPNTTYTIDFSDAISDNNESNPMGNYTFTFSTGEQIDTLEVSGYVLDASNLEPVKGISVGLYNDTTDTVFRSKPLMRISRTDASGHFSIKGVAPGTYRVYALQDADGNFCFSQKSEMIAFSPLTVTPYCRPDIRQDTIWRDSLHIADIRQETYTHFFPDDFVLLAFTEKMTDRYLLKADRKEADRISVIFSSGSDSLPRLRGLNFRSDSAFVVERSAEQDTLTYWLRDSTLIKQDTLTIEMSYQMTDSTGTLVAQTDTIEVVAKTPYEKRQKQLQRAIDDWTKEQQKLKKRGESYDSVYPAPVLTPEYKLPRSLTPGSVLTIRMPAPLLVADTAAIHLLQRVDSIWQPVSFVVSHTDSLLRTYTISAQWLLATEYSLETDSAAFVDIYGRASKAEKKQMKVVSADETTTITVKLSAVPDTAMVVQLLDRSDKVVAQQATDADGTATFSYLAPAVYFVRAFADRNGNGRWDTGLYDQRRQAEEVFYYNREIEAKAKWKLSISWNVTEQPLYRQKPATLSKQKSDSSRRQQKNRNAERARKLGIEFIKGAARQ